MHGQLASHHDAFAIGQALGDDDIVSLPLAQGHLAEIGGVIRFDDVDKRTLLADLRGLVGNQHGSLGGVQDQPHVHELARPKMAIGVGDGGAQTHGAGAVLHGIIEESEFAGAAAIFRVRGNAHQNLEASSIHLAADFGQVAFGDREVGVDRIESLNQKQRSGIGLHDVADVHQARTGAAIDGRVDMTILEVELGVFHGGFGSLDLRLVEGNGVFLGFVIELRDGAGIGDAGVHLQLRIGEVQGRAALRQLRFRGVELRLIGPRIDGKERLIFFELRAVVEQPLGDAAGNLRRHGDRLEGAAFADLVQIDRNVMSNGLGDRHGRRRHLERRLSAAILTTRGGQQGRHEQSETCDGVPYSHPTLRAIPFR